MDIDSFVALLHQVHRQPRGISAQCPVPEHGGNGDRKNSLSVNEGRFGGIVLHCHGGCTEDRVLEVLGVPKSELIGAPRKVKEYPYTDMAGNVLYIVERWYPKAFRGYLPEPSQRVFYNQVCIPWAKANNRPVLWVEGEEDVDSCTARGIPSVTGCGGAGLEKILPQYIDALEGVDTIVVADNDPPGRDSAREKARRLEGVARSVQLMHTRFGKDITDAFDAGYKLDEALEPLQTVEGVGAYLAAHIEPRKLEWAWKGHFALGKLGMIEGDPGDGKSIMTIDLAARWSTGMRMPDGSNGLGPTPVLMVSAEDDLEDTLIPRLIAAGANLRHIHLMTHGATPEDPFTFKDGLVSVTRAVQQHGIRVVFFDPLMAFLSGETDSHNDASVRRALQPLKILASNLRVAVIMVRHLNKGGSGSKAIYRGGGSIAFTGAVRHTFLVTTGEDDSTRVLSSVKNNLARKPDSLTYTIEVNGQEVPYIRWGETIKLTAQEALDGPGRRRDSEAAQEMRSRKKVREVAGEFLLEYVHDGPKTWEKIVEAGKLEGHSEHTLRRARSEVGLSRIAGDRGLGGTTWGSPETPPSAPLVHLTTQASTSTKGSTAWSSGQVDAPKSDIPESDSDLTEEERRDDALMALPLECDVCGETEGILRWFTPYWVIRCQPHNPRKYGGGNGEEEATDNTHD